MPHTPDAAEWWRDRLSEALKSRRTQIHRLENYYNGDHPLPPPPKRLSPDAYQEARKAFMSLAQMGVTNWVKLVADAPSERLAVGGFRFGASTATNATDKEAWRLWQANDLDSQSLLVHDNALQTGTSFVMVDPFTGDITCEHSSEMIVSYVPGSRRHVAAALKLWSDGDGAEYATLILPESVHKWSAETGMEWVEREDATENPAGRVTVTEFAANPTLRPSAFGGGTSEFATVIPIQDRINKTVFDRLVTAEYQAFRQRWIVGWSPPIDEETGLPKSGAIQKAAQATLWSFQADPSEVKIGEFGQADFAAFIKATEADVNAMAAISKTPPHYLLGAMVNISGDALTAAESGLSAKTKKHARNFGNSWEQVIRDALLVTDNPLAADVESEIVWEDIEHRSWGEQVDAVLKMGALNVPLEALWERLPDVSPQEVMRWRGMLDLQALLSADDDADVPEPEPVDVS